MTDRKHKIATLLVALLAITAIAAGGAAGAISLDSETTDTSTTSDVTSSTTSVDLRPGNSSEATYIEVTDAATENVTLVIKPEDANGDVINVSLYTNSSGDTTNATTNNVAWNVTHDELEDLPRDVDGGSYRLIVENSSGGEEQLNQSFTYNHKGSDRTAIVLIADETDAGTNLLADRIEISETFGYWGAQEFWTDNGTTVSTWSGYTTVNGTNTTVEVHVDNSSTGDAYSEAAEDYDDGDWIRDSTLWVNGIPVKVYLNEAPDDAPDEVPYAIWHDSSEELEVVHQGDAFDDVRNLQLRGGAGEAYGFGTLWSEFGVMTAINSLVPAI